MKNVGDLVLERILTGEVSANHLCDFLPLEWDYSDIFPLFLSFFLFSQSRKHANKVRLYYMLHPVDGGCPAKKLRADNVSPPVQHWAPSCCMSPHGVGNHWQTCTHPSTARQSHTPTLTLNGFSAPPPSNTSVTAPAPPHRSPERLTDKQRRHISTPMNNATVTALWSDALNTTLWGIRPSQPSPVM